MFNPTHSDCLGATEKSPVTPVVKNRRLSSLSSSKVRAAFKSPCRSPNTPQNSTTPSDRLTPSPLAAPRPVARKRRSALSNSFLSPLKCKITKTEETIEDTDSIEKAIELQEKEISELEAEGFRDSDLQLYIDKLHEYNEIKDTAQMVIGHLAVQLQTTTRELYSKFGVEMDGCNLHEIFGDDLESMVEAVIDDELKDLKQGCNDLTRNYKELETKFDDGVVNKLSEMHRLFEELDRDVTKLEQESAQFTEELIEYSSSDVEKDTEKRMAEEEDISKTQLNTSRTTTPEISKSVVNRDQENLEEIFKHIKNGRIDAAVLKVGRSVLGFCKSEWKRGIIIDQQRHKEKQKYKVRFALNNQKNLLQATSLACVETFYLFRLGQIPVGSRVAANYKDEGIYSGIIAETADRNMNRSRFLIFFDDGYAMYCSPKHVYLTYGPQVKVWNEITHKPTAQYIEEYLSSPGRHMLSLKEGQTLKVEFDGEWHRARCLKVDCSLVEILYLSDNSHEWIYRGSTRLEPLYRQQHCKDKSENSNRIARAHTGMRKAHIEFVDLTGDSNENLEVEASPMNKREGPWEAPWSRSLTDQKINSNQTAPTRIPNSFTEMNGGFDVASHIYNRMEQRRKSDESRAESNSKDVILNPQARTRYRRKLSEDTRRNRHTDDGIDADLLPQAIVKNSPSYTAHACSPQCVAAFKSWRTEKTLGVNPLAKPLLCGWAREVCRLKPVTSTRGASCHVYYRAPCGRACRNMVDVERYMVECGINDLDYDHFCFDHTVRTIIGNPANIARGVERPKDVGYFVRDYSGGKEDMPISCVNEINSEPPPVMPYTKVRVPGKGVKINSMPEFMVCCDCPDNCRDRSRCPCQQLTVQATSCCHGGKVKREAGYRHKRLFSFLSTGIYECNSRCKCNQQCKNRVVQKGLQCRLQMFKTHKKGWGIRCLDDIAHGTFVCIYTGMIQTEANANKEGLLNGDEYLAELDHIEVAESQKNDYNSDNSSGIDSRSDLSSDEEEGNLDKLEQRRDSTDTDESEGLIERNLGAVTVIGGQKRKLGYSTQMTPSSMILLQDLPKRRANMVMKKVANETKPNISQRLHDDDTTDTDSDSEIPILSTARKTTGDKKVEVDPDSDEEANGTRSYFGPEGTFIIDAKKTGNLGRYLNHSCTPNLMVQNVFIDTHDLRFPWVAFFASRTIKSGTELTWDYNYEIGSVPDRVIPCYCGSTKCRKRLL